MTEVYYQDEYVTLYHGDCRDVIATMPDESIDAVVTDPPYELGFMGSHWDSRGISYDVDLWRDVLRVLKPGGHLLAFGGSRTWHRLACAVEDAGFEIRDSIAWLYGSGFPKSYDVSKLIDRRFGATRPVVGVDERAVRRNPRGVGGSMRLGGCHTVAELEALAKRGEKTPNGQSARTIRAHYHSSVAAIHSITAPATPEAEEWRGWGTALKPAFEPIVVGRKPLDGTVAANVLAHGTGALNIDACRTPVDGPESRNAPDGRWPTNVVLDESQAGELDVGPERRSRFFPTFHYEAKAPKRERVTVGGVQHPTVKPLALMQWLVRLVAPRGAIILDPFAGSGTTLVAAIAEGMMPIGIEREEEYLPLIRQRLTKDIAIDLGSIA